MAGNYYRVLPLGPHHICSPNQTRHPPVVFVAAAAVGRQGGYPSPDVNEHEELRENIPQASGPNTSNLPLAERCVPAEEAAETSNRGHKDPSPVQRQGLVDISQLRGDLGAAPVPRTSLEPLAPEVSHSNT